MYVSSGDKDQCTPTGNGKPAQYQAMDRIEKCPKTELQEELLYNINYCVLAAPRVF